MIVQVAVAHHVLLTLQASNAKLSEYEILHISCLFLKKLEKLVAVAS